MAEWRDMESAPRDGTWVKLLIPYDRLKFSEAECTDAGYWDADAEFPDHPKGCWRYEGDDGPFDMAPVAWMPLPSPPETENNG